MIDRDYYEVLGISKSANAAEIKNAFKKLTLQNHPDKFQDPKEKEEATHKFYEIKKAYDVLSDEEKRSQYDKMGHSAFKARSEGGSGGGGFYEHNFSSDDMQDIFSQFFGGFGSNFSEAFSQGKTRQGQDLSYEFEISLEEAFTGIKSKITIPRNVACSTCKGSCNDASDAGYTCPYCKGKGKIQAIFFMQECNHCFGEGKIFKKCKSCSGNGVVREKSLIDIEIPRGIMNDMQVKIHKQGNAGVKNAKNGDLYLVIKIKPNSVFKVKDNDLYVDIPLSLTQAVLGAKLEVPTIDGEKIIVDIKPGTNFNEKVKVSKKGMPFINNPNYRGDMFIVPQISVPKSLSKKEKELWELLAQEEKVDSSFFNKVSDYFKNRFG